MASPTGFSACSGRCRQACSSCRPTYRPWRHEPSTGCNRYPRIPDTGRSLRNHSCWRPGSAPGLRFEKSFWNTSGGDFGEKERAGKPQSGQDRAAPPARLAMARGGPVPLAISESDRNRTYNLRRVRYAVHLPLNASLSLGADTHARLTRRCAAG